MKAGSRQREDYSAEKMINLSQETLIVLLIGALFCGVALGVFYDVIRTVKLFFGIRAEDFAKKKTAFVTHFVTFFFDFVFWTTAGMLSITLLYGVGGGIFRGIAYFAMAVGYLVYYFTLGNLVRVLSEKFVVLLKKILSGIFKFLLVPAKKFFGGIIFLYHLTIGRIIGKIKETLYSRREKRRVVETEIADSSEKEELGGKEELVYVDGRTGYRKDGRVSFGTKKRE